MDEMVKLLEIPKLVEIGECVDGLDWFIKVRKFVLCLCRIIGLNIFMWLSGLN